MLFVNMPLPATREEEASIDIAALLLVPRFEVRVNLFPLTEVVTPVILLFKWGKLKEAAAVSALFIWVNSAAGLMGQISSGVTISSQSYGLVAVALIGGFFGSYYGSKKFDNKLLRYMLSTVLIIASVKLIFV